MNADKSDSPTDSMAGGPQIAIARFYTGASVNLPLALLVFASALAAAPAPDRQPIPGEWGYHPAEAATVTLNPPSLTWVHERDAVRYSVEWARDASFRGAVTVTDLPWSVYTHNRPLAPGKYFWHYRTVDKSGESSAWSRARSFTIPGGAVE